jgi:hypothetical protein
LQKVSHPSESKRLTNEKKYNVFFCLWLGSYDENVEPQKTDWKKVEPAGFEMTFMQIAPNQERKRGKSVSCTEWTCVFK